MSSFSAACAAILALAVSAHGAAVVSTWAAPVSGSWNVDANWTNSPAQGGFPNNGNGGVVTYDAAIDAIGAAYTVTLRTNTTVEQLTINSSNATLTQGAGSFTANTGLKVDAGKYRVNNFGMITNTSIQVGSNGSLILGGGIIKNGTVSGPGTFSVSANGNNSGGLDGVTLGMDLSVPDGQLFVKNILSLTNNAKVTIGGPASALRFESGTHTVAGSGQVLFTGLNDFVQVAGDGTQAGAATVSIGSGVAIHVTQNANIHGGLSYDSMLNQGTISADTSGQTLIIDGNFSNRGTLSAPAGTLTIYASNWSGNGSALAVSGTGVLNLGGSFSLAGAGPFTRTGGTVNLNGILDNTGSVLALNASTGSWNLVGGTVKGGTLSASDGAALILSVGNSGTFDGVTLASDFGTGVGTLTVKNGLTLTNNANVAVEGLSFLSGAQTLGGSGQVSSIAAQGDGTKAGAATLTIAPGITIHPTQNAGIRAQWQSDSILNQGMISTDTVGKSLTIDGNFSNQGTVSTSAGTLTIDFTHWTNLGGTLAVSGTGILNLGGTFSLAGLGVLNRSGGTVNLNGLLTNTGVTLALNAATGSWNLAGGSIVGGTVTGSDGAGLSIPENNGAVLDGVSLGADFAANGARLTVRNGLSLLSNAKIILGNSGSFGSYLGFDRGVQTLGGNGEVIFGGSNSDNHLQVLDGFSAATLTIGAGILVHGTQGGFIQSLFSSDSLVNKGTISADTNGKTISITGGFSNAGTLNARNGGTLSIAAGFTQTDGITKVGPGSSITVTAGNTINIAGGSLAGAGAITANVANGGTITPGSSAGMLTIAGDLSLGVTSDLQIEIGGTVQSSQYDLLSEAGSVPLTLAGTLSVKFINGFLAAPADSFTIVTSNQAIAGDFSNVVNGRVATADSNGTFAVTRSGKSVTLSNFAVPEPATGALCLFGLCVLLGSQRRRG